MKKVLLIAVFLLFAAQWSFSQNDMKEVVYLKNGSVIKGIIVEQVPNKSLKIETADGNIFVCEMEDIVKITKERAQNSLRDSHSEIDYPKYELKNRGYKGFLDFGYTIGTGDYGTGRVELTTSHGYQFNPYLFLGAGTGLQYYHEGETFALPIFADIRGNFTKGPIVPFIGFKIGYTFVLSDGLYGIGCYLAPNVGVKFAVANNKAINLTLGYTAQLGTVNFYYGGYYFNDNANIGGLSIKAGFEF